MLGIVFCAQFDAILCNAMLCFISIPVNTQIYLFLFLYIDCKCNNYHNVVLNT
jgi:hypothetical protein